MLMNSTIPTIEPLEAIKLISDGAQLVDVREIHEWNAGHAEYATHIPLGSLSELLHLIDREKSVIVCCRAGSRSSRATTYLLEQGINAKNLSGGMNSWAEVGLEIVDASGANGFIV